MKTKVVASAAVLFLSSIGVAFSADNEGRDLAANCAACHGTSGHSVGGMPTLAGLEKNYIVQQMQAFKSGARPATIMHQLAKGYQDGQIVKIAEFLAAQKPRSGN